MIPDFRKMTVQEMNDAVQRVLEKNRNIVANIVDQIREGKLSNEGKVHVVYLLGELRARDAVSILIENVDFEAVTVDPKTRIARWGQYPAQEALVKIGKPASSAVLNRLSEERNEVRRKLMCAVLHDVEGKEVSQLKLRRRLQEEKEADKESRLRAALKLVDGDTKTK